MRRLPWISLCLAALLWATASGCLFVRHSTHIVRERETPRAAQFESEAARTQFEAGLADVKAHANSLENPQVVAVPFLFWYSRTDKLSETAVFNDQLLACDTNGDGFITAQEAAAYRDTAKARAAAMDAQQDTSDISVAQQPKANVPPGIVVQ